MSKLRIEKNKDKRRNMKIWIKKDFDYKLNLVDALNSLEQRGAFF